MARENATTNGTENAERTSEEPNKVYCIIADKGIREARKCNKAISTDMLPRKDHRQNSSRET